MTVVEHRRATSLGGRSPNRNRRGIGHFFRKTPALYVVPALVILVALAGYPLFVLFRMAFSDVGPTNIVGGWNWVGLDNIAATVSNSEFWYSLLRTIALSAVLLGVNLIIGFFLASVLSFKGKLTNFILSLMVFIWALPPIVSGSVWKFLLDEFGLINSVLRGVGLSSVDWLSSPSLALWSCAAVVAWAGLPFSVLILRGGLLAIQPEVVEAAAIDGAGYWRTQIQIVLPLVRSTMWILAILTILYAFKSFDFFYVLTQGGPGTATNTLAVMSYFTAFSNYNMSAGASIAVLAMLAVALFAIPYVRGLRKEVTE